MSSNFGQVEIIAIVSLNCEVHLAVRRDPKVKVARPVLERVFSCSWMRNVTRIFESECRFEEELKAFAFRGSGLRTLPAGAYPSNQIRRIEQRCGHSDSGVTTILSC